MNTQKSEATDFLKLYRTTKTLARELKLNYVVLQHPIN